MPSGIAGTQPSGTGGSAAPENVQIELYGGYSLTSYAGVGFQENEVATMAVSVNGQADTKPADFKAEINWGDGASWDPGSLVYQGTNGNFAEYIIKGSHVYQTADTAIPIVIYVAGPDGTSVSLEPNDLDHANVTAMPSGLPGTQPPGPASPSAPADVQIELYGGYSLRLESGCRLREQRSRDDRRLGERPGRPDGERL